MMRRILVGAAIAGFAFGISATAASADANPAPVKRTSDCVTKPAVTTDVCAVKPVISATNCVAKPVVTTTNCVIAKPAVAAPVATSSISATWCEAKSTITTTQCVVRPVGSSGAVNTGNQIGSQWSALSGASLLNGVANNSVKNVHVLNVDKLSKIDVSALNNQGAASGLATQGIVCADPC
ncbi:hypothetical protein ACWGH8_09500 [Nonomuraea muscovyensis]|uniref:Secreted protein n=1 Tax=Nonomuraea muscovyensis TaxID=1124761 RepID=A0A7X0EYD0_9ACTN|nr:hypothetical protein [Nonomuraea muscovyensis]MBB6345680.1 hypothetical protein [Nonomuraea muscovyensis]MDF2706965.1 hypothetical protein [Nonomuraea muscovyensis]